MDGLAGRAYLQLHLPQVPPLCHGKHPYRLRHLPTRPCRFSGGKPLLWGWATAGEAPISHAAAALLVAVAVLPLALHIAVRLAAWGTAVPLAPASSLSFLACVRRGEPQPLRTRTRPAAAMPVQRQLLQQQQHCCCLPGCLGNTCMPGSFASLSPAATCQHPRIVGPVCNSAPLPPNPAPKPRRLSRPSLPLLSRSACLPARFPAHSGWSHEAISITSRTRTQTSPALGWSPLPSPRLGHPGEWAAPSTAACQRDASCLPRRHSSLHQGCTGPIGWLAARLAGRLFAFPPTCPPACRLRALAGVQGGRWSC